MREPRLYVECDLQVDSEISLPQQSAHYLASVLRRKVGQYLHLFNGEGFDYRASIIAMSKREVTLQIHSRSQQQAEPVLNITLEGVDISEGGTLSDQDMLNKLVNDGNINTD